MECGSDGVILVLLRKAANLEGRRGPVLARARVEPESRALEVQHQQPSVETARSYLTVRFAVDGRLFTVHTEYKIMLTEVLPLDHRIGTPCIRFAVFSRRIGSQSSKIKPPKHRVASTTTPNIRRAHIKAHLLAEDDGKARSLHSKSRRQALWLLSLIHFHI
jgi:hypothetical protein